MEFGLCSTLYRWCFTSEFGLHYCLRLFLQEFVLRSGKRKENKLYPLSQDVYSCNCIVPVQQSKSRKLRPQRKKIVRKYFFNESWWLIFMIYCFVFFFAFFASLATHDEYVRGSNKFAEFFEGVLHYVFGFPVAYLPQIDPYETTKKMITVYLYAFQIIFNPIFITTLVNFIFIKTTKRA